VSLIRTQPRGSRQGWLPWALVVVGVLLITVLALAVALVFTVWKVANELALPVLAILGVVALITTLVFGAIGYNRVGMSNSNEALGLPAGSVRAVIALSLIVLFAILTVYLFSSLSNNGHIKNLSCLTAKDRDHFVAGLQTAEVLHDSPLSPAESESCPGWSASGTVGVQLYRVTYRVAVNQASEDFAKQLLVLIGTLVTAVASFYFGAKAVSEARDVVTGIVGPPSLTGMEQSKLPPGQQTLCLFGANLNGIKQVQITSGDYQVSATSVTSNDNRVEAAVLIPADVSDDWDVEVSDGAGRSAKLPKALTTGPVDNKPATTGTETGSGAGGVTGSKAGAATDGQPAGQSAAVQSQAVAIVSQLETEQKSLTALKQVNAGTPVVADAAALLDSITTALNTVKPLLGGTTSDAAISAALASATTVLGTAQNSGLPGILADSIALLKGLAKFAAPVVGGIPAGPVGIAAGVLFGIIQLWQDQQKFNALKSALLAAPFDPTLLPTMADGLSALTALQSSPLMLAQVLQTTSTEVALTLMQAALERSTGGSLVPSMSVVAKLLAMPSLQTAFDPSTTPAVLAQAVDEYRSGIVFKAALAQLAGGVDVPAAVPGVGTVSLQALANAVLRLRADPRGVAAIEKLVTTAEALAKLPADKQAILDQATSAFGVALDLVNKQRQTGEAST
jgi:hypothetical protein